jgi:hypothetical protein
MVSPVCQEKAFNALFSEMILALKFLLNVRKLREGGNT